MTLAFPWRGVPPSAKLRAALAAADLEPVTRDPGAGPLVVATAGARPVPSDCGDRPWIWISATPLPPAAADQAARRGAYDMFCLDEPAATERLVKRLGELLRAETPMPDTPEIIAHSPVARKLLQRIWQAARTKMPVLLTGETGTGKEVLAGLLHRWSGRGGAYVPINCAAIPNELMESELFGHMRGAFSGAVATVDGKLLAARGGTAFLDEIDDTPLSVQTKLLRVLEDGAVTRVGEAQARPADFRLVAATNRNLLKLVEDEKFGLDLYERLAIVRIELPPLRERREDIPAFVRHFIARFYDSQGLPSQVSDVSARALSALHAHAWAGNIRELRNIIYQALVGKRAGCSELLLSDVRPLLDARQSAVGPSPIVDVKAIQTQMLAGTFNLRRERRALESQALTLALEQTGGRAAAAARLLGEVGRGASSDPGGTIRAMARRLAVAPPGRTRGRATAD